MTVSATVLAKVTFPSEQPFRIIFVLLVSAFGQADVLLRAAAELPTPPILTGPLPSPASHLRIRARGYPGQSALGEANLLNAPTKGSHATAKKAWQQIPLHCLSYVTV